MKKAKSIVASLELFDQLSIIIDQFIARLEERDYPKHQFFWKAVGTLEKVKTSEKILPFITTYNPAVSNLKTTLIRECSFIQNQPLLAIVFKKRPILSTQARVSM